MRAALHRLAKLGTLCLVTFAVVWLQSQLLPGNPVNPTSVADNPPSGPVAAPIPAPEVPKPTPQDVMADTLSGVAAARAGSGAQAQAQAPATTTISGSGSGSSGGGTTQPPPPPPTPPTCQGTVGGIIGLVPVIGGIVCG